MDLVSRVVGLLDLNTSTQGKAVFLDGPWGCGKTYNWNKIKEKFAEEPPIYISLFGITSKDDIQKKLETHLVGGTDSKTTTGRIRKLVSHLNLKKILEDNIPINLNIDIIELFNERKIVCFDDLERVSGDANIKDVLGYINYLVEHKRYRVLIVLNSSEMSDQHYADYNRFKEKLSLLTIKFQLDEKIESILDNMIDNNIRDQKSQILDLLKEYDLKNLRTLRSIAEAVSEIKTQVNRDLPPSAMRFLFSLYMDRSEGNERNEQFFDINRYFITAHKDEKDESSEVKSQRNYIERFYPNDHVYTPFLSLVRLAYDGTLSADHILSEIFLGDQTDEVTKRILEIRELHLFFKTDQELNALATEIDKISKLKREFTFEEVATLVRKLSGCIKLLEKSTQTSLPQQLASIAVSTLKKHENLQDLERSFGYRGDELIPSFRDEMLNLVKAEALSRYTSQFDQALVNYDPEGLKHSILCENSVIIGCVPKAISAWRSNLSIEERYNLISILFVNLRDLYARETKYFNDLNDLANFFLTEFFNTNDKTNRLRFFRLLEQGAHIMPTDRPKAAL